MTGDRHVGEAERVREAAAAAVAAWAAAKERRGVDPAGFDFLAGRLTALVQLTSGGDPASEAAAIERGFAAFGLSTADDGAELLRRADEVLTPETVAALRLARGGLERAPFRSVLAGELRLASARHALAARDCRDREERQDTQRLAMLASQLAEEAAG